MNRIGLRVLQALLLAGVVVHGFTTRYLRPVAVATISRVSSSSNSLSHSSAPINRGDTRFAPSSRRSKQTQLRDLLGLGPAEIAVTLVVALVLFGPETLKSLSKDVGRAAAELKEIPKTFKEGMDEGAETAQIAKLKAIAAEKRAKRDASGDAPDAPDDE